MANETKSILHNWDVRWKLFSLFIFIFTCSAVKSSYNYFIIVFFIISLMLFSKIKIIEILKSIRIPFMFLFIMISILILTSGGEIIFKYGIFTIYKTGIDRGINILVKSLSMYLIIYVLFNTSKIHLLMKSLIFFKIPSSFVLIILFTYRYIFFYMEDIKKLFVSAKLRGYSMLNNKQSRNTVYSMLVNMLIRSYEQSDRIYKAMKLRGFNGEFKTLDEFKSVWSDVLKSFFVFSFCSVIILVELL